MRANVVDSSYNAKNLDIKLKHICYIFMGNLIAINKLGKKNYNS